MDKKTILILVMAVLVGVQCAGSVSPPERVLFDSGKWLDYGDGLKMTTYYKAWKETDDYVVVKETSFIKGKEMYSRIYWIKTNSTFLKWTIKSYSFGKTTWKKYNQTYSKTAVTYWKEELKPYDKDQWENYFKNH